MSNSEKFCLKWNDFQGNIHSTFSSLREDTDFADVTLVCEDGQQVGAHKIILVASSPFFHNLLKRNKHAHPLIYMRGVKSEDLVAILDFLYYGEARIYQEHLDSFLAIAEELKLKGLAGGKQETEGPTKKIANTYNLVKKEHTRGSGKKAVKVANVEPHDQILKSSVSLIPIEVQELENKIKSMMRATDTFLPGYKSSRKIHICQVCGKEGIYANIKTHIEANHIEGIDHPCNSCDKIFRLRKSLKKHTFSSHKNYQYLP